MLVKTVSSENVIIEEDKSLKIGDKFKSVYEKVHEVFMSQKELDIDHKYLTAKYVPVDDHTVELRYKRYESGVAPEDDWSVEKVYLLEDVEETLKKFSTLETFKEVNSILYRPLDKETFLHLERSCEPPYNGTGKKGYYVYKNNCDLLRAALDLNIRVLTESEGEKLHESYSSKGRDESVWTNLGIYKHWDNTYVYRNSKGMYRFEIYNGVDNYESLSLDESTIKSILYECESLNQ